MTGAEINARIREILSKHPGIIAQYNPDSRRADKSGRGWPDWVFVGKRILYREVKGSNDVLSAAQRRVAWKIMVAGGDWEVWGPLDVLPDGLAEQQLEAIA